MFNHCIVGAGASGILLILLLIESRHVYPKDIALIDPQLDGGDLTRKWYPVISNTPWSVTINAIRKFLPSLTIPTWALEMQMEKPTPVGKISRLLVDLLAPYRNEIKYFQASAQTVNWSNGTWIITLSNGNTLQSGKVHLTFGSESKSLSYPVPSIPLEIALDSRKLSDYIRGDETVVVFGTAHSGTLVLKNLVDSAVKKVYALHTGTAAFKWARDGEYDGLKLEAAAIADDIVHLKYPAIQLIPLSEVDRLPPSSTLDWVIYAIGFQSRKSCKILVDGSEIDSTLYDGRSGRLTNAPNAWGFGIAYPSLAPDAIHWDVGISSFLEHIHRQIPQILS